MWKSLSGSAQPHPLQCGHLQDRSRGSVVGPVAAVLVQSEALCELGCRVPLHLFFNLLGTSLSSTFRPVVPL